MLVLLLQRSFELWAFVLGEEFKKVLTIICPV